jgi:hypothetical protein
MFICTPCLDKSYSNTASFTKSYGQCEICEKMDHCNDIPSRALKFKDEATFYVIAGDRHVVVAERINGKYHFDNPLTVLLDDAIPVITNEDALGIQTIGGLREAALKGIAADIKEEFKIK